MTIEEARLFFAVPDEVEIEEYYEEQLFEYKQFFLAKSPIVKVFQAKLAKLKQMHQAHVTIAGLSNAEVVEASPASVDFPDNLLNAFNAFEGCKRDYKLKLMQASNVEQITAAVENYLQVTNDYRAKWMVADFEESSFDGTLSKDPDPMYLLREIRAFELEGGKVFHDVVKFGTNSFLLNEMKRVSLLNKKYGV